MLTLGEAFSKDIDFICKKEIDIFDLKIIKKLKLMIFNLIIKITQFS